MNRLSDAHLMNMTSLLGCYELTYYAQNKVCERKSCRGEKKGQFEPSSLSRSEVLVCAVCFGSEDGTAFVSFSK